MIYQTGDYVYPSDLPRPHLCRVSKAETLGVRDGHSQILKLEPVEGPWPQGTTLIRLDDCVIPAQPRQLWQGSLIGPTRPTRSKLTRSHRHAA